MPARGDTTRRGPNSGGVEGLGVLDSRWLPDPAFTELWEAIVVDDAVKTRLRAQAVLNFTARDKVTIRRIRARGQARLSAWVAFGFVFNDVNRYSIEVDQQGQKWSTLALPAADFAVQTNGEAGETLDGPGDVVAVGVSVTGSIDDDVRQHLSAGAGKAGAVLFITPNRPLGRDCLRTASDAVSLADGVKEVARAFVKRRGARRLLLYYFGPLSGACFIGHRLNAVSREIVVMERADPTYVPSFVLE